MSLMSNQHFQFQFQLSPGDWAVIRKAGGQFHPSPAKTIKVWAGGLVVCLLLLGAIGEWIALATVFALAVFFLVIYAKRIQPGRFGTQEFLLRTLTLNESKLTESWGHSQFEKSWDAFDEFRETEDHFLFKHHDKITLLPKRAIASGQLDDCRRLINEYSGRGTGEELPLFAEWFQPQKPESAHRFFWENDDIKRLSEAQMMPFDPAHPARWQGGSVRSSRANRKLVLVAVVAMIVAGLYFLPGIRRMPNWLNVLLFPLAISLPFVVAYIWWRYTNMLIRNQVTKIPPDEIHVTQDDSGILVGYPKAVARYGWQDISSFFISEHFIGFRPQNGMVHVIANRAFGGLNQAADFLLTAERHRQRSQSESMASPASAWSPIESGNPYQPPGIANH